MLKNWCLPFARTAISPLPRAAIIFSSGRSKSSIQTSTTGGERREEPVIPITLQLDSKINRKDRRDHKDKPQIAEC